MGGDEVPDARLPDGQDESAVLSDQHIVEINLTAAVLGGLDHYQVPMDSGFVAIVAGIVKTNNTVYPEKRGDGYCARIETHIEKVKALGFAVKLDTNGCYPEKLKAIVNEGLIDYVAMDVKNCLRDYGKTVGIKDFDTAPIKESVDFLINGICSAMTFFPLSTWKVVGPLSIVSTTMYLILSLTLSL